MTQRPIALAEAHELVQVLVGATLNRSHRAVDMEIFDLGPLRQRVLRDGSLAMVGIYGIHIQASWRLVRDERVVVGYEDIRRTPTGVNQESWDRDLGMKTARDELLQAWFQRTASPRQVVSAIVPTTGDLRVAFDDGSTLEVFALSMDVDDEFWRVLRPTDHVVVGGFGAYLTRDENAQGA